MILSVEFKDGSQQDFVCTDTFVDEIGDIILVGEGGKEIGFIARTEIRWALSK